MDVPRILISALRGGSGKTIISIGIAAAWRKLGKEVASFKKGPDYIDTGWLALAAGRPCYNLDTFLAPKEQVLNSFVTHASHGDISIIEGNRGLYDGIDLMGSTSTAELAKLIKTPVVLCIDATKSTRTMAAAVLGCMQFDSDVDIRGVILNRVAGPRHENILRSSIEKFCHVPVVGAIPKLGKQNFPERHMGLIPTPEHAWAQESVEAAAEVAIRYLDLAALESIAHQASALKSAATKTTRPGKDIPISEESPPHPDQHLRPQIGIIKDSAFQFYYPENIEALERAGADILFFSPLQTDTIPPLDGLYIGGGFPETHAEQLAQNIRFKEQLHALAEQDLPIYAECGGLMYLGEALVLDETSYPMVGVLPVVFGFSKKPQGHGYTVVEVEAPNPYFDVGLTLKGHEFHYSRVIDWWGEDKDLIFSMRRGTGFTHNRDGVSYKNVLATYTHIHALGTPSWAKALVQNARVFKTSK